MRTHNRDHTPEPVPTPGVPLVPTSPPRAPRTGANRTQSREGEVSNAEFKQSIHTLAQLVAAQTQRLEDTGSASVTSEVTRVGQFIRMNPPKFSGAKVEEDPQEFVDEMEKIFKVMHIDQVEGVKLAAYQLKDVANQWYNEWEVTKGDSAEPTEMLNRDMDFARLSVHIQQVKEKKKKKAKSREKDRRAKRARATDQSHSQQQSGNLGGKCQAISRETVRQQRVMLEEQANSSAPPPQKGATSDSRNGQNRLYALTNRQETEALLDVVTGMLQIFSRDVFEKLKDKLTAAHVLTLSKGTEGFDVYCDASRLGLGYVLIQHGKLCLPHVMAGGSEGIIYLSLRA
ncbi:uncharacterized protein LOC107849131 [Capsicum annuum]|uniref:uncharacterized protein LOC107849131 n=1 Tax=Capsicum annuum TaxID=4072 RepID=UPI0007BF87A3|nr:uncharacterized protein LOC107849131 [Capsicum annuum]